MNKINETDLAMLINNQTMIDYLDRFRMLATSLFTWENLDKYAGTGASRFLEQSLYENGRACFLKDSELGYLALRVNPSDKLNVYMLPIKVMAWSIGYNKEYDFDDIVYIMNNEIQKPTMDIIQLFAKRLYETERTIDTNLIAQKTPVLIEGDTKTILTLKNVYMQYSGNTPFIFGNRQFDISNKLNVLKTDAPYLIDKLDLHKHQIFNEALTVLGINNANTDKKERLITNEVESNDQLINYYLNCFYKTRKKACDEINDKFLKDSDIKIEIVLNKEVIDLLNKTENDILSEIIKKAYKFDKRKNVQRVDFNEWNPEENIYEKLQRFCIDKDNKVVIPNDKILKIYGDFDKLLDKDVCVEDVCCMVQNVYLRYKLNSIDCL